MTRIHGADARSTPFITLAQAPLYQCVCGALRFIASIDPIGIFDWTRPRRSHTLSYGNRSHYGAREFTCRVAASHQQHRELGAVARRNAGRDCRTYGSGDRLRRLSGLPPGSRHRRSGFARLASAARGRAGNFTHESRRRRYRMGGGAQIGGRALLQGRRRRTLQTFSDLGGRHLRSLPFGSRWSAAATSSASSTFTIARPTITTARRSRC